MSYLVKENMRILLAGDPGVGKTSVVSAFLNDSYTEDPTPRYEDVIIPGDITMSKMPVEIIDYSSQKQSQAELMEEINKAHVICLVYDVSNSETIMRISEYWIPMIRNCQDNCGKIKRIVLVGNKCDLLEGKHKSPDISEILYTFNEVEVIIECSSKYGQNLTEVFHYSQKAVFYPVSPLYACDSRSLSNKCKECFTRIFQLSDKNNDGFLSEAEFFNLQWRCFEQPMTREAWDFLKQAISENIFESRSNAGVSLEGFFHLNILYIQKGHPETCWKVLNKFGYDENLNFDPEYLFPSVHLPSDCSVGLSTQGHSFLKTLFKKYDQDNDNCLSPKEVDELFAPCPTRPWGSEIVNIVQTNPKGWITLEGFLAYWVLTTSRSVRKTLEYLAYFGYQASTYDNQLSAITMIKDTDDDLNSKKAFRCLVVGAKGVGKKSFLHAFLGRDLRLQSFFNRRYPPSDIAINKVHVYGHPRYLILQKVETIESQALVTSLNKMCDIVCLLYDSHNPHSFEVVAKAILEKLGSRDVPIIIVATKCDVPYIFQDYFLTPEHFCEINNITRPTSFSANDLSRNAIFEKLAFYSAYPNRSHSRYMMWKVVKFGASVTGVTLMSYFFLKAAKKSYRSIPYPQLFLPSFMPLCFSKVLV